ncbi:S8 family serine peptidase [Geobacter sp. DSM 9736]|uniref:S8 family serine peptidase n=1 Tax=Geobacter sp. DSM 9736 TaxID=1277350 RepID=UPI000B502D6D|nr:S8 family serine peptidase [Geobacter sp. DSM 9736]SNB45212.1 Serine protease, subtilisin family [Geobacter sp. DSM 9736]
MNKRCNFILLILLVQALFVLPSQLRAEDLSRSPGLQGHVQHGRLDPSIDDRVRSHGRAEVLVVLSEEPLSAAGEDGPHESGHAEHLTARTERLAEKKNRVLRRLPPSALKLTDYDHFPVIHLDLDESSLTALLEDPGVVSVNPNRRMTHFLSQSLPLVRATDMQAAGYKGSGTSVAVLDTGVNYSLSAFGSCTAPGAPSTCRVPFARDFAPDDARLDDNGHGTNVAGIVLGVAPQTDILALDVFRTDGYAYDSDLLAALNWVVQNRALYNITAVNMSLGGGAYSAPCPSVSLATAVSTLKSNGILSVIASGNEARNGYIAYPACIPGAVSVGAVYDGNLGQRTWSACTDISTAADQVTCFTNMAGFISMLAPGAWSSAAGYTYAGTSQATPHVAGAVALLKSAHPLLSADSIAARLASTGDQVTNVRQGMTYVKPRLNLKNALAYQKIGISPASASFGMVAAGNVSPAQAITISNTGSAPLVLGTLSLSGTGASFFSFAADGCSGATLSPQASCTVSVYYRPTASGSHAAFLEVPSNDPDFPLTSLPLSGTSRYMLTVNRNGSGTVAGTPAGISCGSSCSAGYAPGTVIILTATPASDSLFSGWSGNCAGTGPCQITINADTQVTANFLLKPPAMVSSTASYFTTLSAAYAAAPEGAVIALQDALFTENPALDRNVAVTLNGGYDSSFAGRTGLTLLRGTLTVSSGTVTIADIVIE